MAGTTATSRQITSTFGRVGLSGRQNITFLPLLLPSSSPRRPLLSCLPGLRLGNWYHDIALVGGLAEACLPKFSKLAEGKGEGKGKGVCYQRQVGIYLIYCDVGMQVHCRFGQINSGRLMLTTSLPVTYLPVTYSCVCLEYGEGGRRECECLFVFLQARSRSARPAVGRLGRNIGILLPCRVSTTSPLHDIVPPIHLPTHPDLGEMGKTKGWRGRRESQELPAPSNYHLPTTTYTTCTNAVWMDDLEVIIVQHTTTATTHFVPFLPFLLTLHVCRATWCVRKHEAFRSDGRYKPGSLGAGFLRSSSSVISLLT